MTILNALAADCRDSLQDRYRRVRSMTLALCSPLTAEDMQVQCDACASPTKWHLAHTTWFFETLVLKSFERGFKPHDARFPKLFNSYYYSLGERHPRDRRGLLTRPSVDEVLAFREAVDHRIVALLADPPPNGLGEIARIIELGLHHEQQHQELMLTDIKLLFSENPLQPAYRVRDEREAVQGVVEPIGWQGFDAGVVEIGWGQDSFAYDNETPRHRVFLEPYALADRLVSNREFAEFVEDGGYQTPTLWLDEGWARVQRENWKQPMYWTRDGDGSWWHEFTLHGVRRLEPAAPVCHVSFFEADAYARWAGARLPTEAEWEHGAADVVPEDANFLESDLLHPARADGSGLQQMFGDVWEWTRSAHEPYPGYSPPEGALGEYNGKFMCGSFVLRGGSCVSSRTHIRPTYRNFFEPGARWQFSGFRLARDET